MKKKYQEKHIKPQNKKIQKHQNIFFTQIKKKPKKNRKKPKTDLKMKTIKKTQIKNQKKIQIQKPKKHKFKTN